MLKMQYEIIPNGNSFKTKTIGEIKITNDGTGNINTGNYIATYTMYDSNGEILGNVSTKIKRFSRRTLNAWDLLQLVIKKFEKLNALV